MFAQAPSRTPPAATPRSRRSRWSQLRSGCLPLLRAARHSAARRGLDMRLRMGDTDASRVSSRQGLGVARLGKVGEGEKA